MLHGNTNTFQPFGSVITVVFVLHIRDRSLKLGIACFTDGVLSVRTDLGQLYFSAVIEAKVKHTIQHGDYLGRIGVGELIEQLDSVVLVICVHDGEITIRPAAQEHCHGPMILPALVWRWKELGILYSNRRKPMIRELLGNPATSGGRYTFRRIRNSSCAFP